MKLFICWLRGHWRGFAVFTLMGVLLALSFTLYGVPLRAVAYPMALCAGVGLVCLGLDWIRFFRKHSRLREINIHTGDLTQGFSEADSLLERDYQQLLEQVLRDREDLIGASEERFRSMMEYYTIWVHQIKTPIAAMRLQLQNQDTQESRALLAELGRIEQYVQMVLTYLRLDSDSTDYCFRTCDMDTLMRGAVRKFAGEFIGRKLTMDYTPLGFSVLTDEKWLSFVLEQVLSNALKYTPSGTVSIYPAGERTLCIRDTGIGIAPEDLPRIFEKGYTGFNGRTDKRASGIGLYLCRRVCGNLGHGIRVESTPGVGTAVFLSFPEHRIQAE